MIIGKLLCLFKTKIIFFHVIHDTPPPPPSKKQHRNWVDFATSADISDVRKKKKSSCKAILLES